VKIGLSVESLEKPSYVRPVEPSVWTGNEKVTGNWISLIVRVYNKRY